MMLRRIAVGVVSVVASVSLVFVVGCVPEKKKTTSSHTSIEKNALDAEQAELEMAANAAHDRKPASAKKHEKVAKAKKSVEKTQRQPAAFTGDYVVQVGAFKVKENAERLNTRLQGEGFKTSMRAINHSKNGELYLVHLNPTKDRSEADTWAAELKAKSFSSQIIRR
ncbi:MAG TPA: SPOR domain-containing protein [Bdellovibrionales bacterium]|nr:SPOR domain-containing protein [Bdellovibrionales bacterium]